LNLLLLLLLLLLILILLLWAWRVAQIGRREACVGFWWGNLRERDHHWGDPGIGGGDNIKLDLPRSGMWGYGLDWAGSGYTQVASNCEGGNELSGSIKRGEFLE
jgi:hypothetical protein